MKDKYVLAHVSALVSIGYDEEELLDSSDEYILGECLDAGMMDVETGDFNEEYKEFRV